MAKDKTKPQINGRYRLGKATANWKYKVGVLLLFNAAYLVFYVLPNFYSLFQPRELPLLFIDLDVPFLPWTFVVYLSEYILIGIAVCIIRDREGFDAFARGSFGALFIIGSIFFLFPTIYPRPVYPPQENVVLVFAMGIIKTIDAPTNCFPSLHVAITSVAVYALCFLKPKVWLFFCLWGVAIFASTLTTKQHYFVDIMGGLAVAFAVIFLDGLLFRKKINPSFFPRLSGEELQGNLQTNIQNKPL